MNKVRVIGAGLAGSEAAYQLLKRGYRVELYEMRKVKMTPCHHTALFAELVCSNSLKSASADTASGSLKQELDTLDCLLLRCARETAVPSGSALAVNREDFSRAVERELRKFERLTVIDCEYTDIDDSVPTIIASGPLTSDALSQSIARYIGDNYLHFYDAAAPIISADSIDFDKAFFAVRYNKGEDTDYLNCGMQKEEYDRFYEELIRAKSAELHSFDKREVFESCMPVEVMAKRGRDTIRYGMMKPKGIINPKTGERYYAVVQLRKENKEGNMYNMVGFQTNLAFGEQKRVFSMIPGLENAEFLRYGVMHRNTFINAPEALSATFKAKRGNNLYFAGQITGVEGYVESIMSGLIAALNMHAELSGMERYIPPATTITGALMRHISAVNADFQPMNANFGVLPDIGERIKDKKERKAKYAERALKDILEYNEVYFKGETVCQN